MWNELKSSSGQNRSGSLRGDCEHILNAGLQASVITLAASTNGQFKVCAISKSDTATAANIHHRAIKVCQQTHTGTQAAWRSL